MHSNEQKQTAGNGVKWCRNIHGTKCKILRLEPRPGKPEKVPLCFYLEVHDPSALLFSEQLLDFPLRRLSFLYKKMAPSVLCMLSFTVPPTTSSPFASSAHSQERRLWWLSLAENGWAPLCHDASWSVQERPSFRSDQGDRSLPCMWGHAGEYRG